MHQARMRFQLQQQLGYLERSARLFDLGFLDEGIRIATSLRILFHDRPRDSRTQGSLYKLLGRPPIALRTTCRSRIAGISGRRPTFYDGYLHLPSNIRPWNEYLKDDNQCLSVNEWWSQVIFIVDGNQVTRRQLTLWAAEKDGGAHADSQLHPGYEALRRMWISVPFGPAKAEASVVPHQHLLALRRFALEVLASHELLSVAWPEEQNTESGVIGSWPDSWSPVMNRARDIAATYFANRSRATTDRDGVAIGRALKLLDEIRLPLSEWHADYLTRTAQFDAALKAYGQIQSIHPGHQHSLYGLGYVSHQLHLHDEAERHLLDAATLSPEHVPTLFALANLYLTQDRFQEARPYYERVLTRDPTHEGAKTNLKILELSERADVPELAIQALAELGNLYLSLGLSGAAKSAFERVLQFDPDHGVALNALNGIRVGGGAS